MSTTTTTTTPKISRLRLGSADAGRCDPPGGFQSSITCEIDVCRRGRPYRAELAAQYGGNQGYFQIDYSHGPWVARGDTPREAALAALAVVPEEHADDLAAAVEEALAGMPESVEWADVALAEAARIRGLIDHGDGGRSSVRAGGQVVAWLDDPDDRRDLRIRLERQLRRSAGPSDPHLASVSDAQLIEEARRRGIDRAMDDAR